MARKSRPSKSRRIRPSKMGRKWTQDDVHAYNITVVYEDLETFFGVTDLPSPDVEIGALTAQDAASATGYPATSHMLLQMEDVVDPDVDPIHRRSDTVGFVLELLRVIRYADARNKRFTIMWPKLQYLASQGAHPELDICIWDDSKTILLVVKVDRRKRGFDPEARIVSDAIGAFHNDNIMRLKRFGTKPLDSKVMHGIVMDGTMPTFYKIPITAELVRAVEAGEQPEQETVVHAYRPEVPRPEEGMKPLDNRYIILSCLASFRQFL